MQYDWPWAVPAPVVPVDGLSELVRTAAAERFTLVVVSE